MRFSFSSGVSGSNGPVPFGVPILDCLGWPALDPIGDLTPGPDISFDRFFSHCQCDHFGRKSGLPGRPGTSFPIRARRHHSEPFGDDLRRFRIGLGETGKAGSSLGCHVGRLALFSAPLQHGVYCCLCVSNLHFRTTESFTGDIAGRLLLAAPAYGVPKLGI